MPQALLSIILGPNTGWAIRDREGRIHNGIELFGPRLVDTATGRYERFRAWLDRIANKHGPIGYVLSGWKKRDPDPEKAHIQSLFGDVLYEWVARDKKGYTSIAINDTRELVVPNITQTEDYRFISALRGLGYSPKDIYDADAIGLILFAEGRLGA